MGIFLPTRNLLFLILPFTIFSKNYFLNNDFVTGHNFCATRWTGNTLLLKEGLRVMVAQYDP